jgi:hypothetical protein
VSDAYYGQTPHRRGSMEHILSTLPGSFVRPSSWEYIDVFNNHVDRGGGFPGPGSTHDVVLERVLQVQAAMAGSVACLRCAVAVDDERHWSKS